jgi:oligopeptide transport system substrate-binding protein
MKEKLIVSLTALALVASACGGGSSSPSKKIFSVADSEPDHLTPGNTTSSYSFQVIGALFEGLTTLDPKSGQPVNDEAASISSTDQKNWTVKIKPGLTFQNGEPVNAQSYVDAWNTAAYGPNGWGANPYFANITGYDALNPTSGTPKAKTLSGLKVVDAQTFTVALTAPFSQFPLTLAYPGFDPLPKVAFTNPKGYDVAPVGNGPFEMDGAWQHNQQIKVKKYPGYKGIHKPKSNGILYKIYANRQVAYTDLEAGKVDILMDVPTPQVPDAKRLLGNRIVSVPSGTEDFLGFPIWDKRFANPDLRKAISMAIDRQSITNAVFNGTYTPSGSLFAKIIPGYQPNACGQDCTYDPAAAKQLFQKAGGWQGTFYLALSNADPTYTAWMTAVANQLKQNLGISDVKLQVLPASDYLSAVRKHEVKGPFRQNWVMDYPSPQDFLTPIYGPGNRLGYTNPQFTSLVAKGDAAATASAGIPFYQQAEAAVLNDMPVTPLWTWTDVDGYSTHVKNVQFDPYAPATIHPDQIEVK